jgi:molybdopterin molybdotransferase
MKGFRERTEVAAVLRLLERRIEVLAGDQVPLRQAAGRVLTADVISEVAVPAFDRAAMDGYAVRGEDTFGASLYTPVELRLIGEVRAGGQFTGTCQPGEAVRIMTGAPVPPGADAIVPFEETDEALRGINEAARKAGSVRILKAANPGANIRRRGEDVQAGSTVIQAGRVLRPSEIGVLASIGLTHVTVIRRPVVAILSTGDEITPPGEPLLPGRIYDANAYSVAALVRKYGGIPRILGIARDTVEDLTAKIREGLDADMLVTSAGVSRGDFDVVKDVLAREGNIDFWSVRMRPGKPLAFGAFTAPDGRKVPHLGLPGNPVSSMVSFELFGRPAIFTMLGRSDWERPTVRAISRDYVKNPDARRFYARCIVTRGDDGRWYADLTGPQGSGMLTSMSSANALAVIPEDVRAANPGDEIECIMLDWEHAP